MAAVLGRSDFRFADLKHRTITVFLVLPPDRLSAYVRWLRLLVTQSLTDMARTPKKPATSVLHFHIPISRAVEVGSQVTV
jgi:type IV secretion system protein VirD4